MVATVQRTRDWTVAVIRRKPAAVTAIGLLIFLGYLVSGPPTGRWDIPDRLSVIGTMLKGGGNLGDLGQDVVGFRRLWDCRDPYPVLGPALLEIGVAWDVRHPSTHPPSAFLLVGPISHLDPAAVGGIWATVGFGLLFLGLLAFRVPWLVSLGLALGLGALWGPVAAAFQQLTLVWLAAVSLAYRLRLRAPMLAGAAVGFASLTKFLPLVVLGYFIFQRRFRAVIGAALVGAAATACIWFVCPSAFARYLEVNRGNTWATAMRTDNASVLMQAHHLLGNLGVGLALLYVALILAVNRRALLAPQTAPRYSFFLYTFLAVFLLPICWGYSLAPLLPVVGYFLLEGRAGQIAVAAAAFLELAVVSPFGFAPLLASAVILVSILFLMRPPEERESAGDGRGASR